MSSRLPAQRYRLKLRRLGLPVPLSQRQVARKRAAERKRALPMAVWLGANTPHRLAREWGIHPNHAGLFLANGMHAGRLNCINRVYRNLEWPLQPMEGA
jgi:hypothetical protein